MYSLREDEIDYILHDIESRGVVLEDLRDDLLDHICCIIEREMPEGGDFQKFYESILPRFFKKKLAEIQEETDNLIRFKNFYAMKRIMNVAGLTTALLVSLGALFKTMHWPGAGVMIVSGGFSFSFLFLPLLIILKFRDEKRMVDKLVFGFGIVLAMIIATGVIFKLMHWPMANMLQIGTTVAFTFVYVPLYFFTRIRRPELRFNTIVNSVLMMACGGLLYSLFDLSYSYQFKKEMQMTHEFLNANAEQLFESNTSMMAMFPEDSEISDLHAMNLDLITQIESVESTMDGHMAPWHLEAEFGEIRLALEQYNASLTERGYSAVNIDGVEDLHRLRYYLAKQVIARVKLNLAMSENVALSSRSKV